MSNDPPSYPPAGPPPGGYGGQPPGGYQPPPGGYQPPPGGYQQQPPPGGYQQQPPPGGYQQGPYQQPAYGTPYGSPAGFGAPPVRPTKKWYQRWWVWVVAALAIIIIAVVVLAKVFGNKYQLQDKITSTLKNAGHTVSNVNCPNSINTDRGHTYSCTAVVDGKNVTLRVAFVTDRHFVVSEE
jgi:Domain of unknown function (DUF4333)